MVADSHLHSKSLSTTLSLNNNFLRVDSAILEDSQHSRSQVQWRYARANAGFHCLENNRSSDRLARAAKWRSALIQHKSLRLNQTRKHSFVWHLLLQPGAVWTAMRNEESCCYVWKIVVVLPSVVSTYDIILLGNA